MRVDRFNMEEKWASLLLLHDVDLRTVGENYREIERDKQLNSKQNNKNQKNSQQSYL